MLICINLSLACKYDTILFFYISFITLSIYIYIYIRLFIFLDLSKIVILDNNYYLAKQIFIINIIILLFIHNIIFFNYFL